MPHAEGPLRALTVLFALGLLAALPAAGCGGGGGGGGGGTRNGSIAGTVTIVDGDFGTIEEREPNDSTAQAQLLPPLESGERLVLAGECGAVSTRYGRVDATDAFRLYSSADQDVDFALATSTGGLATANLDLAVFDTATGALRGAASAGTNPETLALSLVRGDAVDVVVTCASGAGAWTLSIASSAPAGVPARLDPRAGTGPSVEAVRYLLEEPDVTPGRIVVRGRDASDAEAARVEALSGGRVVRRTSAGSFVVEFAPRFADAGGREAYARSARVGAAAGIEFAEPDAVVRTLSIPNDPDVGRQWHLFAIGADDAWDVTTGDPSIVIGHVDGGIAAHPDLDSQRVPGKDFVSDPATSGDGDGRDLDATDPGDRGGIEGRSTWHGTHTAGILVARQNDGYGVSGVAPGCRVMPLRVTGVGGGTATDLADALRYAAGLAPFEGGPALAAPLRVVTMSLGTAIDSAEVRSACDAAAAAGTLLVASTGNGGGAVLFPAAYPSVLAVGAVDSRLAWPDYSNRGPEVALVAPGGQETRDLDGDGFLDGILSTGRDETVSPSRPGEMILSGTSMAAPQVAAAAALLLSVDPSLDAAQLKSILTSTARDVNLVGPDPETGAGLLQVGEAVRKALLDKGIPRTGPPRLSLSTTTLRFRPGESVATVLVRNGGGGLLHVSTPVATTDSGIPWLSAFAGGAAPGSATDIESVTVLLDPILRGALAPGAYAGEILLDNGIVALGSIRVVMEVSAYPLTGQSVVLVARKASDGGVVKRTFASPLDGFRYVFPDLPPGDYVIHAGTDFDADGFFCEAGDWCGDYAGAPGGVVTLPPGGHAQGVDVLLTR